MPIPHITYKHVTKPVAISILNKHGFYIKQVISEGTYSKVRQAEYSKCGQKKVLAVKVVNKLVAEHEYLEKYLPRSLDILVNISHPNICKVLSIFDLGQRIYIFMEIAASDLLEFIQKYGRIENTNGRYMFGELSDAIAYLHQQDIVHRDLKCENILLQNQLDGIQVKLADFDFACRIPIGTSQFLRTRQLCETYCGSTSYMAPEVLQGTPYNSKLSDIWSMGVILFIMLTAQLPYTETNNVLKLVQKQIQEKLKFPEYVQNEILPTAKSLIRHMLEPDITKRATIKSVISSKWLAKP